MHSQHRLYTVSNVVKCSVVHTVHDLSSTYFEIIERIRKERAGHKSKSNIKETPMHKIHAGVNSMLNI